MEQQAYIHGSYWLHTVPPGDPAPPPEGPLTVDVAVVGAGIAGLSTALELARREAAEPASQEDLCAC